MRLLVNCERILAHVAADVSLSRHKAALAPVRSTADRVSTGAPIDPGRVGDAAEDTDPFRVRLAQYIRVLVVGEPDDLDLVLAADAVGWSPSGAFTRRDEAVMLSRQSASSLPVDEFCIEVLCWCEPLVFAEWTLHARQSEALLISEDVLIEATGHPVVLHGTTVAEIRCDRVAAAHTHFDDASLIEQVILTR